MSGYIVFDIETTGLSSESDEIIELSAIKVSDGNIADEFSMLVNPRKHIPYFASSINGITDDMVSEAPCIEQVIRKFVDFIGSYPLVGHNICRFDMSFIQRDAERYLGMRISNECIDTLHLANRYLPQLPSRSLESLADHYNVSYDGAHRALVDCKINQKFYEYLLKEMDNPSDAAKAVEVCPRCGNVLRKRNGKFGEFWGCAGYPDCRFTKDC